MQNNFETGKVKSKRSKRCLGHHGAGAWAGDIPPIAEWCLDQNQNNLLIQGISLVMPVAPFWTFRNSPLPVELKESESWVKKRSPRKHQSRRRLFGIHRGSAESLSRTRKELLGGGFKYFYFHPYLGKWSNLTNIFQMGWNHQLDYLMTALTCRWWSTSSCLLPWPS